MKTNWKKRIVSLVCIVCMLSATVFVGNSETAKASDTTPTTIEGLMKDGFTPWTLSDIGLEDQTNLTSSFNKGRPAEGVDSLDKTIFTAKVNFASMNSGAYFYIGGSSEAEGDYSGLFIRTIEKYEMESLQLCFLDPYDGGWFSTDIQEIKTYYPTTASTTLVGNKDLEIAMAIEYLKEYDEKVDIRIWMFFDGVLYDQCIDYKGLPEYLLTQHVWWANPASGSAVLSNSVVDITLDNAPEANFTEWSFSDLGINDVTLTDSTYWDNKWSNDKSLDKTLFSGKINFSNTSTATTDFGNFYIGGGTSPANGSKYNGFYFCANGTTDTLTFAYSEGGTYYTEAGTTGTGINQCKLAEFNSATAGVQLRGNENLKLSLSVEYVSEVKDGKVDVKVGVFFDGKLYDNRYFVIPGVTESYLKQAFRWNPVSTTNKVASYKAIALTIENTQEGSFSEWTFSDLGIGDVTLTDGTYWDNKWSNDKSLDKTLFSGKINFSNTSTATTDFGNFYIGGGTSPANGSKYNGFYFCANGTTDTLTFAYSEGGTYYTEAGTTGTGINQCKLAEFNSATAGVQLRGNENLKLSLSVEYVSEVKDGKVDIKVGVFFDGKLYDNRYFVIPGVTESYLKQAFRWNPVSKTNKIASYEFNNITLQNAEEKDFDYWTLRDINISDTTISDQWNWGIINATSLDKTIFNAKINFPSTGDKGNFGNFYIGGDKSGTDTSCWRGFLIQADNSSEKLTFLFAGSNGTYYDKNGNTGSSSTTKALAVFDSKTAGVQLRDNSNLQVSLSVEVLDTEVVDNDTVGTVKVGVFFDGKLYDNTYYTIGKVPVRYLTQNIRWSDDSTTKTLASCGKASNVALAENGASISTSHKDLYSENTGRGLDVLVDGLAGQGAVSYLGVEGADMKTEPMNLEIAFDGAKEVDTIRLHQKWASGGFPVDFTVSAFTEEGWKTVATKTDYNSVTGWNEITFADTVCSAIRLNVTEHGVVKGTELYGLHLTEIEVLGVPSNADVWHPHRLTQEAVALNYAINGQNANDGSYAGNRGLKVVTDSQTEEVKLQMMFDYAVSLSGVEFVSQEAGEFPSDFKIYAFAGSGWECVKTVENYFPSATKTTHEFTFDAVNASSIMVVFTKLYDIYAAEGTYGLLLQEMQIVGVDKQNACALLGDADQNDYLIADEDMKAMRQTLANETATAQLDANMDDAQDVRDIVRMKRYFAIEEEMERTYEIKTLSWNVLPTAQEGYLEPSIRATHIAEYIENNDFDIVALQEAGGVYNDSESTFNWTTALENELLGTAGYAAVNIADSEEYKTGNGLYQVNRLPDSNSGLCIYYKAGRFSLVDSGAFEYSKYLVTEGGTSVERWCQWAKFEDKATGEILYVTNTHWSANVNASGQEDKEAGKEFHAAQSAELMKYWTDNVKDSMLLGFGDFNAFQTDDTIKTLNADIYKEANILLGDFGSLKEHIDHVFVNPYKLSVDNYYAVKATFEHDGNNCNYSDHDPVFTYLSYVK